MRTSRSICRATARAQSHESAHSYSKPPGPTAPWTVWTWISAKEKKMKRKISQQTTPAPISLKHQEHLQTNVRLEHKETVSLNSSVVLQKHMYLNIYSGD